jgi:hypothetical protein
MNLQDFRALDQEARKNLVAELILEQNPRLRRGADMLGPCAAAKDGLACSIAAKNVNINPRALDGHPYLHMYEVHVRSPFDLARRGAVSGDTISVSRFGQEFNIELTQALIDEHTILSIRFALSA